MKTAKEVEILQQVSVTRAQGGLLYVNGIVDNFVWDGVNWMSLKYFNRETQGAVLRRFLKHGVGN